MWGRSACNLSRATLRMDSISTLEAVSSDSLSMRRRDSGKSAIQWCIWDWRWTSSTIMGIISKICWMQAFQSLSTAATKTSCATGAEVKPGPRPSSGIISPTSTDRLTTSGMQTKPTPQAEKSNPSTTSPSSGSTTQATWFPWTSRRWPSPCLRSSSRKDTWSQNDYLLNNSSII